MINSDVLNELKVNWKNRKRDQRIAFFDKQRKLQRELDRYATDILKSPKFDSSKYNMQHGNISVKDHSISVARYSVRLAKKFHIPCDENDLVRGALLHDYFLYDWHNKDEDNPHRLHGFHHPKRALQNADHDFVLTDRQKEIIQKHMWPLTVVPPTCREAWIVTMADKYCSFLETAHLQKGHRQRRNRNRKL